jgi:hypothetical protein
VRVYRSSDRAINDSSFVREVAWPFAHGPRSILCSASQRARASIPRCPPLSDPLHQLHGLVDRGGRYVTFPQSSQTNGRSTQGTSAGSIMTSCSGIFACSENVSTVAAEPQ